MSLTRDQLDLLAWSKRQFGGVLLASSDELRSHGLGELASRLTAADRDTVARYLMGSGPGTPATSPLPRVGSLEARVKALIGQEVTTIMARHGWRVEPHPTNAGITAMRAKNFLLNKARAGELSAL